MPEAPFLGPTYQNTFLAADAQRCVNWFLKGNTLKPKPGFEKWNSVGPGPIRAWKHHKNELLVVSGSALFAINQGGAARYVSTLDTALGPVHIASSGFDGDQALIVDGAKGYVYSGGLTQVADADFPSQPHHAMFDNGYFGVFKGGSGEWHVAENAYDALAWGGDYATAEQSPDKVRAAIVNRNDVWIIGGRSTEVWYYSGEAFPWNPNRSAFQHYGIAAPETLTKFDNNVAWLAESEEVGLSAVRTTGFQVQRISNTVIETEWARYDSVDDAHAWSFQYPGMGHFLVFQFPTAEATWVYDAQEQMWHEWEEWHPMGAVRRHQGDRFVHFGGNYLIPDNYTGDIYRMSHDIHQDNGKHCIRKRMGPNLISSRNNVVYNYLELIMNTGIGKSGDPTPYVRLSYSDDRGGTWANWREVTLGGVGARNINVEFSRLGTSKERVFKVEVSNDVNATLTNSILHVEEGML